MNSMWILLACGVAYAYAQPTCDESALKKCQDMMPSFDKGDMFPSDPKKLQEQCLEVIPGFNCFVDVAEWCPALVPAKIKRFYIQNNNLVHKVCREGYYHEKYLRSAKCLNDIMTTKQDICQARAEKTAKPYTCEFFELVEDCLNTFVEDTCTHEALRVFYDFFDVIRPIFQNGACDNP